MAQKYYVIVLFQDGLQIVPNIWLNKNLTTAKWPDYISNQRYDKAVKNMEDPQSDWIEYPVTKIFGTYTNYAVARRKLKEAEELTDIDSCTEQEEHLKKTRKIRAAKTIETSSSHDEDEFSEIIKFVSNLPNVPSSSKTDIETNRKSTRKRKDDKFVKNDTGKYVRIIDNSEPSCSGNYFGTMQKDTQRTENLFLHSNSNTECSNGILTTLIENNSNLKPELQIFQTPYNATALGTLFKKCARIQSAEYIKHEDLDGKKAVDDFMVLYDNDYPVTINKKVIEDCANRRRKKQVILPSKSDIKKLYNYAQKLCEEAMKILQKKFDLKAWKQLMQGTLILVQMFNRRRAGEIERLSIENYQNQETIDNVLNPDIFENISEESQQQAKQFVRIIMRGKLGRTVPVLLHTFFISYIDTLLKYRSDAEVNKKNKYVFAVPRICSPKKSYIRACSVIRKFAIDCGASFPNTLRGTMLRKHLATYTALQRVDENQVSDLANFMGHHEQIHKDVYRIPNGLIDMTEVSRLLQAAIGNKDNNNDNNKENSNYENTTEDTSSNDDDNYEDKNIKIINDKPQSSCKKRCIGTLNYDDSDDEILNNSTYCSRSVSQKSVKRIKWTEMEKEVVKNKFGDIYKLPKLPSLNECRILIGRNRCLRKRTPEQLKSWIDNQRKGNFRKQIHMHKNTQN